MKKLKYLFLASMLGVISCNGQKKNADKNQETITNKEIPGQPKVDIKVNRRYDDKGKLIGFDSIYTSYYSHSEGDTVLMDTLIKRFVPVFKEHYSFDKKLNKLFFNDTLLYEDFFHKDFFKQRYALNDKYFQQIMNELDSIKN